MGFENYAAATASAPEERNSAEANQGAPFAAHVLEYGKEDDQATLKKHESSGKRRG